jgi:hypothetical protein
MRCLPEEHVYCVLTPKSPVHPSGQYRPEQGYRSRKYFTFIVLRQILIIWASFSKTSFRLGLYHPCGGDSLCIDLFDRDTHQETGDPARLPAQIDIFCAGPTRTANAGYKNLLHWHPRTQRTNQGRTLFICTLWVPICLSFNSQQGPSLSSLSDIRIH